MKELLFTFLVGLSIVIGIFLGNHFKNNKRFVDVSIGLAFGVLVLLMLLDVAPEAIELLNESVKSISIVVLIISALIGLLALKLLDSFIPHHEHESLHHHKHKDDKCHNEHLEHVGLLASIAVIVHNIIEGMTLYVTLCQDFKSGLLLSLAIALHNIPLGIVISSTLNTKKDIIKDSIMLSISTLIGGIIMLVLSNVVTSSLVGILLSVTMGMVIYISFFELLPQIIYNKEKKYNIIGVLLGIVIIIISTLLG